MNQEETENLNRLVTTKEIERIIKNLASSKSLGPDGFTGKFHQMFREITSVLLLTLPKN